MLAVVVFPADPSLALSHFQKYYTGNFNRLWSLFDHNSTTNLPTI